MIACGLVRALSVMVTTPESDPFDFGVKVTLRMHRADGFTTPPLAHVVPPESAKLPLTAIFVRFSGVVPVLVSVTDFAALVLLTFCVPKFREYVLSIACGLIAVAVSGTDCGLPAAVSVMMSKADCCED